MIQFAYQRKDSYNLNIEGTLALDVPTKEFLSQLFLTHSNKTMFMSGLSIKSDKDSFEKKKGRELALTRLAPILFDLDNILQDGTKHIFEFCSKHFKVGRMTYLVRIRLTTVAESDQVKLIAMYTDHIGNF